MKKPTPRSWLDRINKLERLQKENPYSSKFRRLAYQANIDAMNWVTCACGAQDEGIPRNEEGIPKDAILVTLGSDFYYYISHYRWENARITLVDINFRAHRILKEIEEQNEKKKAILLG